MNPVLEHSSLHWVPSLDRELTPTHLPGPTSPSPAGPLAQSCGWEENPWVLRLGGGGHLTSLNLLQGNVLSQAARSAGSSTGSFRLFCSILRLSSTVSPAALPLCRETRGGSIGLCAHSPQLSPTFIHPTLTHPGRARGRGPQLASGLAWKRLSPRWRELGLASSRMVKLACSLGKWEWGLKGICQAAGHTSPRLPAHLGAAQCTLGKLCLQVQGLYHLFNKHLSSAYSGPQICCQ